MKHSAMFGMSVLCFLFGTFRVEANPVSLPYHAIHSPQGWAGPFQFHGPIFQLQPLAAQMMRRSDSDPDDSSDTYTYPPPTFLLPVFRPVLPHHPVQNQNFPEAVKRTPRNSDQFPLLDSQPQFLVPSYAQLPDDLLQAPAQAQHFQSQHSLPSPLPKEHESQNQPLSINIPILPNRDEYQQNVGNDQVPVQGSVSMMGPFLAPLQGPLPAPIPLAESQQIMHHQPQMNDFMTQIQNPSEAPQQPTYDTPQTPFQLPMIMPFLPPAGYVLEPGSPTRIEYKETPLTPEILAEIQQQLGKEDIFSIENRGPMQSPQLLEFHPSPSTSPSEASPTVPSSPSSSTIESIPYGYAPSYAASYSNYSSDSVLRFQQEIGHDKYKTEFISQDGTHSREEGHFKQNPGPGPATTNTSSLPYSPASANTMGVVHVKQGEVSWTSPECIRFTLRYEADENGYRPSITETRSEDCLKYGYKY